MSIRVHDGHIEIMASAVANGARDAGVNVG
jgi:multimeric flavodoxin WrbA